MDLKIEDVAELLNESETTIQGWLSDGKIPAYKLNGQYRFSKIEIENWMLKEKLSEGPDRTKPTGEKEIFSEKGGMGNQQFALFRALNRGGVYKDIEGTTKEEIIRNTMQVVAEKMRLDADVLAEMLLDRESLTPTALNNGVAVPHARECLQHVPFDLITVVFPKKPIAYGALDEKPVDVLFFLFATGDKIHLRLLSKIAHLSSNEEFMQFLRTHPEQTALLERVREWESSLKTT